VGSTFWGVEKRIGCGYKNREIGDVGQHWKQESGIRQARAGQKGLISQKMNY